ncbi:MAG: hypothetical protein FWC26_02220 [Fibromonadales bacterium]|nr:hypothetical protein [Fibromonadales bacterium]
MSKNEKSAAHQLAHYVLPYYLKNCENKLLEAFLMSGTDPEEFLNLMNFLTFRYCEATDEELEMLASEFELAEEKVAEGLVLVTLKMPEPKEFLEAKYLLFAFIVQDDEVHVRYFTYELGTGNDGKQHVYFVCEWAKNGTHINYNYLEVSDLESFVDRVKLILFKKRFAMAWVPPRTKDEK